MDFSVLRKRMVEEQLIPRGIKNERVLEVFRKIERHKFVLEELRPSSYADYPLPIGEGQTISQPYIVALMTESLLLRGDEKVLEIGTGSGYQAAILSQLSKEVYSVERFDSLAKKTEATLKELGYLNIKIKVGDGTLGWPEEAPFDRIIITAASPRIPLPLVEQLKEGGKIILPLGDNFSQLLSLGDKINGKIETTEICSCVFVTLIGKYACKDKDAL